MMPQIAIGSANESAAPATLRVTDAGDPRVTDSGEYRIYA